MSKTDCPTLKPANPAYRVSPTRVMPDFAKFLRYDPDTGDLHWLVDRGYRVKAGDIAGSKNPEGYVRVGLFKRYYAAHRVAWFLYHGSWPECGIDHINGVKDDNRISNIREDTHNQNQHNRGMDVRNTSGCIGVGWCKRSKAWRVRIAVEGKRKFIGLFKEIEDATTASITARRKFHPFCRRQDEMVATNSDLMIAAKWLAENGKGRK